MKRSSTLSLFFGLLLSLVSSGCGNGGVCDRDFYVEVTGFEMLKTASLIDCFDNLEWYTVGVFEITENQLDELLDSKKFEPIRSSLNMVNTPIRRINKIFEEIDELSQYRPETTGKTSCTITLKEDERLLVVSISYPDQAED